jgi:hypothetical protein
MSYQSIGGVFDMWCSDRTPTCPKPWRNICKPMNVVALGFFKALQIAANRFSGVRGFAPIPDDGRPGPDTIKAVNKALGTDYSHCDQLAANVVYLTGRLNRAADELGLPKKVAAPKGEPSVPDPTQKDKVIHPESAGFMATLKSPLGIAAAAISVLLLTRIKRS